jgi:hypothetical protein
LLQQLLPSTKRGKAIDQFKERMEKSYFSYCDIGVPIDFITAASTCLILAEKKLAVCKPGNDYNQGIHMQAAYQKVCEEVLQQAHALRQYEKGKRWLWLFQTYVKRDALAYLQLDRCIAPSGGSSSAVWKTVDEAYHHWKNDPDTHRDRRWTHIEELRSQALTVRDRMRTTPRTLLAKPQDYKQ